MLTRIYLDANAGAPLLPEVRDAMVAALGEAANAVVGPCGGAPGARIGRGRARRGRGGGRGEAGECHFHQRRDRGGRAGADAAHLLGARRVLGRAALCRRDRASLRAGRRALSGRSGDAASGRALRRGSISLRWSARWQRTIDAEGAPYLALMLANNETGVIHPVAEAARIVKAHGGYVFCDAVQALGRIPVDIGALGVDFLCSVGSQARRAAGRRRAGPRRRGVCGPSRF